MFIITIFIHILSTFINFTAYNRNRNSKFKNLCELCLVTNYGARFIMIDKL